MSLGNAGNSLDGQLQTMATQNEDGKKERKLKTYPNKSSSDEDVLKATWNSTTPPSSQDLTMFNEVGVSKFLAGEYKPSNLTLSHTH